MDLVGARLNHGVHDCPVATSEFSAVGVGLNLELGNRIDRRLHHIGGAVQDVAKICVVVDAVQQEIILQRAGAVGAEAIRCYDARSGFSGSHANAQQSQLRVVASVQGKRVDALTVD